MSDVDDILLQQGTPTNIWSTQRPTYDIEYADDTLLMGLATPQLQNMLSCLEAIAAEYGMRLNQSKTEVIEHPKSGSAGLQFSDGSAVKTTPQAKYLESQLSWIKPFDVAFQHRLILAEEAFKKLRLVWNSSIPLKERLTVCHATFLPVLLYGLEALTLTDKQLHRVDGQ